MGGFVVEGALLLQVDRNRTLLIEVGFEVDDV
jgi:hypothetical protein